VAGEWIFLVSFFIAHVLDVRTGSENDNLTPGRNLKILGRKIKIEGESDANGVYFPKLP
jgi:hypothetical protein